MLGGQEERTAAIVPTGIDEPRMLRFVTVIEVME
jgi:hypothetical protein